MELLTEPKPIPEGPTHCRGCGQEIEPLRRWGGLCKRCVYGLKKSSDRPRHEPVRFRWRLLEQYVRIRPNGIREKRVRVICECGRTRRTMGLTDYNQRKSLACRRCLLADIRLRGVESDYAK